MGMIPLTVKYIISSLANVTEFTIYGAGLVRDSHVLFFKSNKTKPSPIFIIARYFSDGLRDIPRDSS